MGFDGACLIHGKPEVLSRFCHDIEANELIWGPPDEILTYDHFRSYQRWMSETAISQDVFLGAEMGLGKTGASLWAACEMLESGEVTHWLIIAPLRVAEETWPEEIAKWDFARGLKYRVVTGDEDERRAALKWDAQVTIVNRENLSWLQKVLPGRKWVFDGLIYDEASRLKSGRKRSKPKARADGSMPHKQLTELGILRRNRFKFNRIIELSGTPSPNGLVDLWGPIYLIDQGKRLEKSMTRFKERWFYPDTQWERRSNDPFPHAEAEIMAAISDVFYSLKEEDYLKLPPMIPRDHVVTLPGKAMQMYRDFEREQAIELRDHAGEPAIVEAVNKGVLTGKLLQFANGSLYLDDHSAKKIHEAKLDALDSIITESMGQPILCAYSFRFDMAAIKKRFPFVRIFGESKNDMRDWNAGKVRFMLTHPASAGHGLNFQKGGNIAVWYGLTWSLELYRQFIKRLHRSGQQGDHVMLHRIIAKDTMDQKVLTALLARGATQDSITDAVRVRLRQVALAA